MSTRQGSILNDPPRLQKWMKIAMVIALLAGLGIGLLGLIASLGVWLGLWDFRQGFSFLRTANTHARWLVFACAGIGFLLLALARLPAGGGHYRYGNLALLAACAALLVWVVPESYRPAPGTPPIHDITTDLDNPPAFVDVLPLRGDTSNPVEYGTSANMTPERQAQLQRDAYPDIQPLIVDTTPEETFRRALAAVNRLGWDMVASVPEEGRIEATDTTFWFRFKDDVVIRIQAENGGSRLDARSTSRVGVSDVGKNAARLREFFETFQAQ